MEVESIVRIESVRSIVRIFILGLLLLSGLRAKRIPQNILKLIVLPSLLLLINKVVLLELIDNAIFGLNILNLGRYLTDRARIYAQLVYLHRL
jgi:hypothetical protein